MAESASRQQTAPEAATARLPRLRDAPFATALAALALLLAGYGTSIALSEAAPPVLRPDAPFGLEVEFRMNLVMMLISAYTIAVGLVEFRSAPGDLGRLRELLDCDDETFVKTVEAYFPTSLQALLAVVAGSAFGACVSAASSYTIAQQGLRFPWDLHDMWNVAVVILLFALLGLFALWGVRSASLYSALSRQYARVSLLDTGPFQLFATRGLRLALFWFVGSGLALLLVVGAQAREVVIGTIAVTCAVGVASLILPSLGIHQRMREAKAAELMRVRGEIESRLDALRAGYSDGAAELPALLAWEARVREAPEWPLGGGVLFRFGLLILIPVGSWLGGALVERMVDATLG